MDRKAKMIGLLALAGVGVVALAATSGTAHAAPGNAAKKFGPAEQAQMAEAIRVGTPNALSAAAASLESQGFKEQAAELRRRAEAASRMAPPPTREAVAVLQKIEPGLNAADLEKAAKILRDQADPVALKAAADKLRTAGFPLIADQIDAKGAGVAVTNIAVDAMKKIEVEQQKSPGIVPVVLPTDLIVVPRTETEVAANNAVRQINAAIAKYNGNLKLAKASRAMADSVFAVKKFQTSAGLTPDGKSGPGTTLAYAKNGVGVLPPVLFWPVSANGKTVLAYRAAVLKIADQTVDPLQASALRQSAARERGQAGIVGQMPV